jgi:hypothetical protein
MHHTGKMHIRGALTPQAAMLAQSTATSVPRLLEGVSITHRKISWGHPGRHLICLDVVVQMHLIQEMTHTRNASRLEFKVRFEGLLLCPGVHNNGGGHHEEFLSYGHLTPISLQSHDSSTALSYDNDGHRDPSSKSTTHDKHPVVVLGVS